MSLPDLGFGSKTNHDQIGGVTYPRYMVLYAERKETSDSTPADEDPIFGFRGAVTHTTGTDAKVYVGILNGVLPTPEHNITVSNMSAGVVIESDRVTVTPALLFNPQSSAPAAVTGNLYFDSVSGELKVYSGGWQTLETGGGMTAHDLTGALHTEDATGGVGNFLKADSTTTFSWQAHGLVASDVGAYTTAQTDSAIDADISTHAGLPDSHHVAFVLADFTTAFAAESLANLATRTHASLSDAPTDAHHAQAHTLSGSDHTGDLAYTQVDAIVDIAGVGAVDLLSRADHVHTDADGSSKVTYGNLSGIPSTFTPASHDFDVHTGDVDFSDIATGSTGSILVMGSINWGALTKGTSGTFLKAGATTVSWVQVYYSDLAGTQPAPIAHNLIDTTGHPVSSLTDGHFLKADTATTYSFQAHGLGASDVGAYTTAQTDTAIDNDISNHASIGDAHHLQVHLMTSSDHEVYGLTIGHVLTATAAAAFDWQAPSPGSGTPLSLPVWATSTTLGDSIVTQDVGGTAVTVGGTLTVSMIDSAPADYDEFLVSNSGLIQFRTGAEVYSDIGGYVTADFTTDFAAESLANLATRTHASLSDAPADAHHAQSHDFDTHTGDLDLADIVLAGGTGAILVNSSTQWGALTKGTSGYFLKAGATTLSWAQIYYTDLGGTQPDPVPHVLDSETYHTATGLTVGWVISADSPTTFSWKAPAAGMSAHDLTGAYHTEDATGGAGNVLRASGATAFAWATLAHGDLSDAPTSAHHVRYADSETEAIITAELVNGQSIDLAIDALILTHKNIVDAHHAVYTNAMAVAAVVAQNPLTLTNSLKIGGNDIQDSGGNVVLSSNGLGYIDYLGSQGTPTDDDVLAWDTSTSKWIVQAQTGGTGSGPGTGTQWTLPVWATTTTLGDSMISQDAGGTVAVSNGDFYAIGGKELGSVASVADREGLVMQIQYTDGNTDSRLFFREASGNLYGGSIIYAADVSPVFDGTTFTNLTAANTLYFLTHSNSLIGTVFMSVPRGTTGVKLPGSIALSAGAAVSDIDTAMAASPTDTQLLTAQGIAEYVNLHCVIGSANATWINCPYEGAEFVAGDKMRYSGQVEPYYVGGAGRWVFSVPLPTTRGGKGLYINGTRVSLSLANGSNRVYETNLYGMADTSGVELDSDETNKASAALWEDVSMGAVNLGGYDVAKVILKTAITTAGALQIQYVTVRYYYA